MYPKPGSLRDFVGNGGRLQTFFLDLRSFLKNVVETLLVASLLFCSSLLFLDGWVGSKEKVSRHNHTFIQMTHGRRMNESRALQVSHG